MVEYNPFSPEVIADPYPAYARLRDEAPAYYIEEFDAWALSRFDDIWAASQDPDHYTVEKGTSSAHLLTKVQPITPMINMMDPPEHTRLRAIIRKFYMPRRVTSFLPTFEGFIDEEMATFEGDAECDLVGQFAEKVAGRVACVVTGFPLEDAAMLTELVRRFFAREEGQDGMTPDGLAAMEEMFGYFHELIADRRAKPTDEADPVNALLEFEKLDGSRFDDAAIASHLSMLLIGGAETFPKVFANLVVRLGQHPDQRAEIAADPSLVPQSLIEGLRYDMPTQFLCRVVTQPHEIHGQQLKPGQPVLLLYPSGNRDPREFENPDTFDIHRNVKRHLSFGHGIHACIGRHVALAEGKLALEKLLARYPHYGVHEDGLERYVTEFVKGYSKLPVTLDAH